MESQREPQRYPGRLSQKGTGSSPWSQKPGPLHGNGPNNLAVLRHFALNIMQKVKAKGILRSKFKRAGWDDAFLSTHIAHDEMQ